MSLPSTFDELTLFAFCALLMWGICKLFGIGGDDDDQPGAAVPAAKN